MRRGRTHVGSGNRQPPMQFFLGCVIVAGVVGSITASRAILFVQALPAAIALALVWLSH